MSAKNNKFKYTDKDGRIYSRDNPLGDYSIESIQKFEEMGRIYTTTKGKKQLIRYLDEAKGVTIGDLWDDIAPLNQVAKERLGYPTQKPLALLKRIIQTSSREGEIVLDPFCGCGTTIVSAFHNKRYWLGIDVSPTACKLMKRRLENEKSPTVEIIGLPMTIEELHHLEPFEFQNWIVGAMGGTVSPRKVGDMGIDGFTYMSHEPIQVKQSERVGRPVVDNFRSALERYYVNAKKASIERKELFLKIKGVIVAFSFSSGAYEEVARCKNEYIEIDLMTVKDVVKDFQS